MKIDTSFQIGTAMFGCMCVCYGLRIGDWFGVEVIKRYLGIGGIGVFDYFSCMGWKWMQKHNQKLVICFVEVH